MYRKAAETVEYLLMLIGGRRYSVSVSGAHAKFHIGSPAESRRIRTLGRERVLIERVVEIIRADDVFCDVGANIGLHVCLVASVLDAGRAVAIEPHPCNFKLLVRNVQYNECDVATYRLALSDFDGYASLVEWSDQPGEGGHYLNAGRSSRVGLLVPVWRGDTFIDYHNIPSPTVIKIDVEGAEASVLRGFRSTLTTGSVRKVFCEIHSTVQKDIREEEMEIAALFEKFGYGVRQIPCGRERQDFIEATRRFL